MEPGRDCSAKLSTSGRSAIDAYKIADLTPVEKDIGEVNRLSAEGGDRRSGVDLGSRGL
jgi:hypothetical protein